MKHTLVSAFLLLVALLAGCVFVSTPHHEGQSANAIAVSLRNLTESLKARPNARQLLRINRIDGCVYDEKNNDVVIYGSKTTQPFELQVDDLAVAIQSAWSKGDPPGCSIDPRDWQMQELGDFLKKVHAISDPVQRHAEAEQWIKKQHYQDVRVFGIPRQTGFARKIVEADALLKRITGGFHKLRLKGFVPYSKMYENYNRDRLLRGKSSGGDQAVVRFWFCPTATNFQAQGNGFKINKSSVKLLTEEEKWSKDGQLAGSGKAHPIARKYTRDFTRSFRRISFMEPAFAELEMLFRLVALQKAVRHERYFEKAGIDLDFWLKGLQPKRVAVADTLPAVYSIVEGTVNTAHNEYHYLMPIVGGVVMDPAVNGRSFSRGKSNDLGQTVAMVLASRPAGDSISWRIKSMPAPAAKSVCLF